ncbi:GNAT family N-acetyltransferase [Paenibacillus senegalensis]|uniref:GNAT family N-acetyltransferase n=1 Tax=Paenibacillus senegalensis TaxID=1465766 RepID=UPI00028910DB|nr:GNAT family N-acetyltransferase [Paenibacillus senegalensis]
MIRLGTRKDNRFIYKMVVQELLPYAIQVRPETSVSRAEIERRLTKMEVWIACRHPNGKPAGFLSFQKHGGQIKIDMLAVSRNYQSRGYGEDLMKALERFAENHKADTISLYVDEINEGAIRFYTRLGYTVSAYFPDLKCYSLSKKL